jgi:hypothetical protein
MGLLATVCGLAIAEILSAEFGAKSSGPPAPLKTATTPANDLGNLRQTALKGAPHKATRHKRVHRARKHVAPAPAYQAASPTVAQVEEPRGASVQPYQQTAQPVQQLSAPSNPTPVRTAPAKTAPRPKPSGGGSFDDSG